MEQEDIDLLKVWLCGINDKDVIKTLVLCSEYGSGKTHFIEHQLSNKFNIRNITNDQLNELIEEKPKTYINFLSLIFDTVSLTNTNTKPKLLVINENNIYNFIKYESVIMKIITDNIKYGNKYPIVLSVDCSHNKLIAKLKSKSIIINYKLTTDELNNIIKSYLKDHKITTKVLICKRLIKISQENINKILLFLNILVNNYVVNNTITSDSFNEFLKDVIENDNKNNMFTSNYELLTSYTNVNRAMSLYNNDIMNNPIALEESYIQKLIEYEANNKQIIINTKQQKVLLRLVDSLTYSDLFNAHINNFQQTYLKRLYGYFSCVLPSYLLNKFKVNYTPFVRLTEFNKSALQCTNYKILMSLCDNFNTVDINYYIFLSRVIELLINNKDKDELKLLIKKYNIDISIIDKIMKLNKSITVNMTSLKRLLN